jgi:hypothetical protein
MLELMNLGDVIESPEGLVIGGVNQRFENVSISVVMNILQGIDKIYFLSQEQKLEVASVLNKKVSFSIGNNFNIFLLLGECAAEKMPENGAIIYCDQIVEFSNFLAENDDLA